MSQFPEPAQAEDAPAVVSSIVLWAWQWKRLVLRFVSFGVVVGIAVALMSRTYFESTAVLLPERSEGGLAGLAAAAGQFGIDLPAGSSSWSPTLLASVMRGPAVLGRVVDDSVSLEPGAASTALVDLLRYRGENDRIKQAWALQEMPGRQVIIREDKRAGTVVVTARTEWKAVSVHIASSLVRYASEFDIAVRQAQAGAERRFADAEATRAEAALRYAEAELRGFLRKNRVVDGSADLVFERDRLRREVDLRQQLLTALLQSRDQAALRETRQVPIITVVQEPTVPVLPAPRRRVLKVLASGLIGAVLAAVAITLLSALEPALRDEVHGPGSIKAILRWAYEQRERRS